MKRLYSLLAASTLTALSGYAQPQPPVPISLISDRAASRLLDQASWGPTAASIGKVQISGIGGWLGQQFSATVSDLPDQPILDANAMPNRDLRPVESAFFANALAGDDQLRQRVAFALSEIWVVSAVGGVPDAYAYPYYWRIFRDNAFGNYRDIIKAVTLNPAMGHYLNMANNNKGNAAKGTAANENYSRELMQLFTLGLTQLNPDGSPVLDPTSHQPVPTYDQDVVTNLAKALTGWTYPTAPGATPRSNNPAYYAGQMFAVDVNHDNSAKTIFGGVKLPAGQTADRDLESVLDALMQQRTMAPFISQQLIEHLVTSNPSPAYVARVSQVFLDNGRGVRGDMQAVVTAILMDSEARAGDDPNSPVSANFGHLREPVLFMTGMLRALNGTLGVNSGIYNNTASMAQDLFHAPSVFSYFSPRSRTEKGLFGPEFQIYSTQTVATRGDIVNTVLYGTLDKSTKVDLNPFMQQSKNLNGLLDYIGYMLLHHSMSNDLRQAAYLAANAATTPARAVQAALYIVLTSGEYQVIH